jgi:hypothetical protein
MKPLTMTLLASALALSACVSAEDAKTQDYVGTENGAATYRFKTARYAAFAAEAKLNMSIKTMSKRYCPNGYREISRQEGGQNWQDGGVYPVAYTDVWVTIACN